MNVTSLRNAGTDNGEARFLAAVVADDGSAHTFSVAGPQLSDPLGFAQFATNETGVICSTAYAGRAGDWHAHLGGLLRHGADDTPARSNVVAFAGGVDPARRAELLGRSLLGQTVLASAAAAAAAPVVAAAAVPPETFFDRARREDTAAALARRGDVAHFLAQTPLGRDTLANGPTQKQ